MIKFARNFLTLWQTLPAQNIDYYYITLYFLNDPLRNILFLLKYCRRVINNTREWKTLKLSYLRPGRFYWSKKININYIDPSLKSQPKSRSGGVKILKSIICNTARSIIKLTSTSSMSVEIISWNKTLDIRTTKYCVEIYISPYFNFHSFSILFQMLLRKWRKLLYYLVKFSKILFCRFSF